jgi:hypothetical protein
MVLKWEDKSDISIISLFHNLEMVAAKLKGSEIIKLRRCDGL